MHTTAADHPPTAGRAPRSLALTVAAMASAGAGLVHAAAAGTHNGDPGLALLFSVTAVVQLGWAGLALVRSDRAVAASGVVLGLVAAGAWAVSRTVGLPVVESLSAREPVGTQDLIAGLLGGVAGLSAAWAWSGRGVAVWTLRSPAAALPALAVLALAVPGMAVEHTHGPSHEHDHEGGEGEVVAAGDHTGDDAHGHGDGESAAHGHDATEVASGATDDPTGPVISLDDPRLTADQRAAARALIDDTTAAMARFPDQASVEAAGYHSIGDGITGYEHFIHIGHIVDGRDVAPEQVESIVFRVNSDGTKQVVSAMYILGFGKTMADVPDIAGELTTWHDHQDLCWEGTQVVARLVDGQCPRGQFRATPPMLHVWMVEHPCGPFAGIEGHGEGCGHGHHDGSESAAAAGTPSATD